MFAAGRQSQEPAHDEPGKEEVRVPRPLAKDTWAATHGEAQQLHTNTDRPTIVS